jgi:uncharacterized membrane protein
MDSMVASSTTFAVYTLGAFWHFLGLIWPILVGAVLSVAFVVGIWTFVKSKVGGGGSILGGGKRRGR